MTGVSCESYNYKSTDGPFYCTIAQESLAVWSLFLETDDCLLTLEASLLVEEVRQSF